MTYHNFCSFVFSVTCLLFFPEAYATRFTSQHFTSFHLFIYSLTHSFTIDARPKEAQCSRVMQRAGDMWDIWLPSSLAYGDEGRGVMIGVCACVCVCVLMLASRGDRPWRFSALYAAAHENKMNCLSHTLCCVHGRRKVNEAVRLKLIATPHLQKK